MAIDNTSARGSGSVESREVGLHLLLIHKWRLESHDLAAGPAEEHIATPEQVLGTGGVEHDG